MKAANQAPPKEAAPQNLGATAAAIAKLRELAGALESQQGVLMHYHLAQRPESAKLDEHHVVVRVHVSKIS